MIQVKFDPEQLPPDKRAEWEAWQKKAEAETQKAIAAWEEWKASALPGARFQYRWTDSLWSKLKDWLLANVFHDKCAYCETPVSRSIFQADHFRPKAQVRFKSEGQKRLNMGTCTDAAGQTIDHPGYFWLAYHWWNLFPSCALCNTVRGKKDQFPVDNTAGYILLRQLADPDLGALRRKPHSSSRWRGFFYLQPEDLDSLESPLLLHPYADDPRQHLLFLPGGRVRPRGGSKKGQRSIEVYDLDDEKLCFARSQAQEAARTRYFLAFAQPGVATMAALAAAEATLEGVRAGREPYSAAVLDFMDQLLSLPLRPLRPRPPD